LSSVGWHLPRRDSLYQIHALQRNVQARIFGISQQHELATAAVRLDLSKPFELTDAVVHVDDEVAGLSSAKSLKKPEVRILRLGRSSDG